jgi:hypothetical protein
MVVDVLWGAIWRLRKASAHADVAGDFQLLRSQSDTSFNALDLLAWWRKAEALVLRRIALLGEYGVGKRQRSRNGCGAGEDTIHEWFVKEAVETTKPLRSLESCR